MNNAVQREGMGTTVHSNGIVNTWDPRRAKQRPAIACITVDSVGAYSNEYGILSGLNNKNYSNVL